MGKITRRGIHLFMPLLLKFAFMIYCDGREQDLHFDNLHFCACSLLHLCHKKTT